LPVRRDFSERISSSNMVGLEPFRNATQEVDGAMGQKRSTIVNRSVGLHF
jgi:hypothetical protein